MNSYAQFNEDRLIAELLERIGISNRWCFEVGAHDGSYFSNTLAFREQGWTAVLAEGHPQHATKLIETYGDQSHCVHEMVSSMDDVLRRFGAPRDIDLGVIDIDGEDYWLWHDMEFYRPRVMLIEFSPYVTQDTHDPVRPIPRGAPGQTAKAPMMELAQSKGYELVDATFCNLLFVDGRLTDSPSVA
jgi:hypothetical protein